MKHPDNKEMIDRAVMKALQHKDERISSLEQQLVWIEQTLDLCLATLPNLNGDIEKTNRLVERIKFAFAKQKEL